MPYSSIEELPAAVKDKIKSPKKRRQFMHVWNSSFDEHHDESRAFAAAYAVALKKGEGFGVEEVDQKINFFLPIEKVDVVKRTVSGYASTACLDSDGESISLDALKAALPDYMQWANIREMHRPSAVGRAQEANIDSKGLYITAKIVDDGAWSKCVDKVYQGFSVGGRKLAKVGNTITKISLSEISVVDRPANPECAFAVNMAKSIDKNASAYLVSEREGRILDEAVEMIAKAEKQAKRKKKKLAKRLAEQSTAGSASPSPSARDVEGRVEAALGKVESRHELDLMKTTGPRSLGVDVSGLSLQGEGTLASLELTPELKLKKRRKDEVMGEKKEGTEKTLTVQEALMKVMGLAKPTGETPVHPALPFLKAAEKEMKSERDPRKVAEDCVKMLFDMHKAAQADLAKAGGTPTFDHTKAMQLLQKMFTGLGTMKAANKSARDSLRKAAGRVSNPGTVEDPISGVYDPPAGLRTLSPGDLNNASAAKGDFVSKEHADALAIAAALEAEIKLLKAQPAEAVHGRRPFGFDPTRMIAGQGENGDPNAQTLMKGVDPSRLSSKDSRIVEREVAKMVGNMILSPNMGKSVFDPEFHGTAGGGTA